MIEDREIFEKCNFCFSLIALLHGHCPACNNTGYVKKPSKEPLPWKDDHDVDSLNKFTNPEDATGSGVQAEKCERFGLGGIIPAETGIDQKWEPSSADKGLGWRIWRLLISFTAMFKRV